jgi:hypothetical protein
MTGPSLGSDAIATDAVRQIAHAHGRRHHRTQVRRAAAPGRQAGVPGDRDHRRPGGTRRAGQLATWARQGTAGDDLVCETPRSPKPSKRFCSSAWHRTGTQLRLRRLRLRHLRRVSAGLERPPQPSDELEFTGPTCSLRDIGLGIAVGSAARTAAMHSIDCRCQTPADRERDRIGDPCHATVPARRIAAVQSVTDTTTGCRYPTPQREP